MKTSRVLYRWLMVYIILTMLVFIPACSQQSQAPEEASDNQAVEETAAEEAPAEEIAAEVEPASDINSSFQAAGPGEFQVYVDGELKEVLDEYINEINRKYSSPISLKPIRPVEHEKLISQQAEAGEGDVFISMYQSFYEKASSQGLFNEGITIGYQTPVIIVETGNPKGISRLADFAMGDLKIGLTEEDTYPGQVARSLLDSAGVATKELFITSTSPSEAMMVTGIAGSTIDASIVYKNVPLSMEGVENYELIDIEPQYLIENSLFLFEAKSSQQPKLVEEFIQMMLSEEVQSLFEASGYRPVK